MPVYLRNSERWEARQEDATLITRTGGGPEQLERFASAELARRAFVQRVREHLDAGFVPEVTDEEDEEEKPPPPPRFEELEAAIVAAPDDRAAYAVYADALLARGNPWGELISLQLNGKKGDAETKLEKVQPLLFEELFDAVRFRDLAVTWRWGFVKTARLRGQYGAALELHELIRRFLALPIAKVLQKLELGDGTNQRCVEALTTVPRIAALTELSLGTPYGGPLDLGPLREWLSGVTTLSLLGSELSLGAAAPTRLRVTTNIHALHALIGGLSNRSITILDLTNSEFEARSLEICVQHLEALEELVLECKSREQIDALAEAPLQGLRCLRLTAVSLTAMRGLAARAAAFTGLARIEVSCAPRLKGPVARVLKDSSLRVVVA